MPNPRFEPLTLSQEEWQRIWTTQVETRDEGVNRIVKLRDECEAQAQDRASLRQRLEGLKADCSHWEIEARRIGDAGRATDLMLEQAQAELRLMRTQLAQAQQELTDRENWKQWIRFVLADAPSPDPNMPDAEFRELICQQYDRLNKGYIKAQEIKRNALNRASQAEAALEEMRKLEPQIVESLTNDTLYDDALTAAEAGDYQCECEDCGRLRIDALRKVLAELQRRRSPTGQEQG